MVVGLPEILTELPIFTVGEFEIVKEFPTLTVGVPDIVTEFKANKSPIVATILITNWLPADNAVVLIIT